MSKLSKGQLFSVIVTLSFIVFLAIVVPNCESKSGQRHRELLFQEQIDSILIVSDIPIVCVTITAYDSNGRVNFADQQYFRLIKNDSTAIKDYIDTTTGALMRYSADVDSVTIDKRQYILR